MNERPILMTPENAQKCHEGIKTQTRRIVKVPDWATDDDMLKLASQRPATGIAYYVDARPVKRLTCPYGVVGDRLWIREAFALWREGWDRTGHVIYKGGMCDRNGEDFSQPDLMGLGKWKPSLHMPRWACRTVLEITDVRVERVKDITPSDALAEGVFCPEVGYAQHGNRVPVLLFGILWEAINGNGSWARNDWVWVVSFTKVQEGIHG